LGAVKALNLDGGTSSSLYYQGKAFYGKRDDSARVIPRSVKSALLLLPTQ
jgi:exopolysaccharide biosynthesis protein